MDTNEIKERNIVRDLAKRVAKLAHSEEAVEDRYTIEWRQKATDVVYASDLTDVRKHLERGLRLASGCRIQTVLQELETTKYNLRRLPDWCALAKEIGTSLAIK